MSTEAELAVHEFRTHVAPRLERTDTAQADFDRRVRVRENLEAIRWDINRHERP